MYVAAGWRERTLMVQLFGLVHAEEIRRHGRGAAGRITDIANVGDWTACINDMLKLAPHVTVDSQIARQRHVGE